jgi:hypothetical protein
MRAAKAEVLRIFNMLEGVAAGYLARTPSPDFRKCEDYARKLQNAMQKVKHAMGELPNLGARLTRFLHLWMK